MRFDVSTCAFPVLWLGLAGGRALQMPLVHTGNAFQGTHLKRYSECVYAWEMSETFVIAQDTCPWDCLGVGHICKCNLVRSYRSQLGKK